MPGERQSPNQGMLLTNFLPYYFIKITFLNVSWFTQAPQGKRLQVERVMTAIAQTKDCTLDYLVINGGGQKKYPAASSLIYCGWKTVATPLTTTGNLLLVVYRGRVPWSKGFVLHYKVLA